MFPKVSLPPYPVCLSRCLSREKSREEILFDSLHHNCKTLVNRTFIILQYTNKQYGVWSLNLVRQTAADQYRPKVPIMIGKCYLVRTLKNTALAESASGHPSQEDKTASCRPQKLAASGQQHRLPPAERVGHQRPYSCCRPGRGMAILQSWQFCTKLVDVAQPRQPAGGKSGAGNARKF